jgi:hypothetical protein
MVSYFTRKSAFQREVLCTGTPRRRGTLMRVNPANDFAQQIAYHGPQSGEDGDSDCDDSGEWTRLGVRAAGLSGLADSSSHMASAESIGQGSAVASLSLWTQV